MKKFYLSLILILCICSVFAAPFGLKMGMTIEEIEKQCEEKPEFLKDDMYLVKPIKKHPLFSDYVVYVDEEKGLYQIRAISDSVKCNKYGTEIQNKFNSVKDRISKVYGEPEIIDKVDSNISSLMQRDEYWFDTLQDGSRQLTAVWGEENKLADDLINIFLDCISDSPSYDEKAHLILVYYFVNVTSVEDDQDSVF
jgi:hypothetical protein